MRALVWLRADLRVEDNTALHAALDAGAKSVLPVFVLDPQLLDPQRRSPARTAFLFDCLSELSRTLAARGSRLVIRSGAPEEALPRLVHETNATLVSWSRGSTPYARRRDARVRSAIERAGARVIECKDLVVFESDEVRNRSGRPYAVFTPYRNAWHALRAGNRQAPRGMPKLPPEIPAIESEALPSLDGAAIKSLAGTTLPAAGERAARTRLADFLAGPARHYLRDRDRPAIDGTSRLSPHLRFGTISVRRCLLEAEACIEADPGTASGLRRWIDELVWRDFYHAVLVENPRVLNHNYRSEFDTIEWNDDDASFSAWCEARTGIPIVDAAMRQLVTTGWMHNRLRMIVASVLTKDLLIDWRLGEAFFRRHLIDGDRASNNGGWQWSASTGTDAQPYFRIFNPVLQGERFDPEGAFVRRFLPALDDVPQRLVQRPWEAAFPPKNYPPPIVDHAARRVITLRRYETARAAARSVSK